MSTLGLRIGETQRSVTQLEDSLAEVREYPVLQRASAARELADLAIRIELIRMQILDPGGDNPPPAA